MLFFCFFPSSFKKHVVFYKTTSKALTPHFSKLEFCLLFKTFLVNNLTSFLRGISSLETIFAFWGLKFGEVKYSLTRHPYPVHQILDFKYNKGFLSQPHLFLCLASSMFFPCAPPRLESSFRIVFVFIWVK